MIFELFCYACAIVTVLAFYGSKNLQPIAVAAQPEPEQQLQDESSAQAPDLFVEPEQTPEEWEEIEVEEWPTEPMPEDEPMDELLAIASSVPRPMQLAECGAHQLRTLGVLEELKGARRWKKGESIAHLIQLYCLQLAATLTATAA